MKVAQTGKKHKKKHKLTGIWFVLPAFIGFLLFMIYPLFYSLYLSFMDWDMISPEKSVFSGLENFKDALKNDYFIAGITNNIKIAIIAVPILIIIALIIAVFLNMKIYARPMIRAMYFMPYIITATAAAVVFSAMLHPVYGPINGVLMKLGIENPPGWATSSKWSLFTVGMFWIWKNVGYCIVIFLAGLQGISRTYYEAAYIDGAGKFKQFWNITVPMISPTTFFLAVTCVIQSFQIFAEVNVLTQGGPGMSSMTTVMHIYDKGFQQYEMGYASAVSWLFFILIMFVTIIQWIVQKKWVKYV